MSRTREQFKGVMPRFISRNGITYHNDIPSFHRRIIDVPGLPARGKSLLRMSRQTNLVLEGSVPGGSRAAVNFIPDGMTDVLPMSATVPKLFSNDELDYRLTSLAANTNPATDSDSRAMAIFELRERLPFLKLKGNHILDTYSNAYLGADFGWKAMFRDVLQLFVTSHAVDEFYRNYDKKADRAFASKVELDRRTTSDTVGPRLLQSLHAWVYAPQQIYSVSQKATLYCRYGLGAEIQTIWGPVAIPPQSREQLASLYNVDYKTAWNALPWSWLIDWMLPVSDFLEAQSDLAGYDIDEFWFGLETYEDVRFLDIDKPDFLSVKSDPIRLLERDAHASRFSYIREPRVPSLIPQIPFANASRLGTLSALSSRVLSRYLSRGDVPNSRHGPGRALAKAIGTGLTFWSNQALE